MRLKKLVSLGLSMATAISVLGLITAGTATADLGTNGRIFTGTDYGFNSDGLGLDGDAEVSSLCVAEDETYSNYSPYSLVPPSGQSVPTAAACDNKVDELDFGAYSLEFIPSTDSRALLDPAGNDGILGNGDDSRGPDGKTGTGGGEEPTVTRKRSAIQATWNFAKSWPAPTATGPLVMTGSNNNEEAAGLSAFMAFRNVDIQDNILRANCDRNDTNTHFIEGATGETAGNGINPAPNDVKLGAHKTYLFDPRATMHVDDGTYFHIWFSHEYIGPGTQTWATNWRDTINFGYYDPTLDNDIHYSHTANLDPLMNPGDSPGTNLTTRYSGLSTGSTGGYYRVEWSNSYKTLKVTIPAVHYIQSTTCLTIGVDTDPGAGQGNRSGWGWEPMVRTGAEKANGPRSYDGALLWPGNLQNDVVSDIFAQTMTSVRPKTPVPIPLSFIGQNVCDPTLNNEAIFGPSGTVPRQSVLGNNVPPKCGSAFYSDLDWVIGLGFTADDLQWPDGQDAFWGSANGLPPTLGPGDWPGPTCNTPTFGDRFRSNPLYNAGNACALRNPHNLGLRHKAEQHLHAS